MLWCVLLLVLCSLTSVEGACAGTTGFEELLLTMDLLETQDPVKFSLSVTKPVDDRVHYIRFQNATDDAMNLEEDIPVSGTNVWWPCINAPPLFNNCVRTAPDAFNFDTACVYITDMTPVTWAEIQAGKMFWFLLEADAATETFTLRSYVEVSYFSNAQGQDINEVRDYSEAGLTLDFLQNSLSLDIPDLQVHVTHFQTSVPTGGTSTVTLRVQLYNNKEDEWDMVLTEDPWFDTSDTAVGDATITKGSTDREWIITFDVTVCDLGSTTTFSLYKALQDQSVRYEAYENVDLNLGSLCSSNHNLGTVPASATLNVYSDAGLTTSASSFFLEETLYIDTDFTTFSALSSISIQSATLTQNEVATDITSNINEITSTTTSHTSSLTLSDSFASATVEGVSATLSISYTLAYANTRRRLTANYKVETYKQSILVKKSGCHYSTGMIAHPGASEEIPCSWSGYEIRKCQNNRWEIIDSSQCYLHDSTSNPLLFLFGVCALGFFAYNHIQTYQKLA